MGQRNWGRRGGGEAPRGQTGVSPPCKNYQGWAISRGPPWQQRPPPPPPPPPTPPPPTPSTSTFHRHLPPPKPTSTSTSTPTARGGHQQGSTADAGRRGAAVAGKSWRERAPPPRRELDTCAATPTRARHESQTRGGMGPTADAVTAPGGAIDAGRGGGYRAAAPRPRSFSLVARVITDQWRRCRRAAVRARGGRLFVPALS